MRESRTYGSVRGAHGNVRPYRDPKFASRAQFALANFGTGTLGRGGSSGTGRKPGFFAIPPRKRIKHLNLRLRGGER